ncbi:MAG: hypothetical protein HFE50_06910, partial [Clostridia bacterium]|nr:hypothetical protein [Clostridia bacterium]
RITEMLSLAPATLLAASEWNGFSSADCTAVPTISNIIFTAIITKSRIKAKNTVSDFIATEVRKLKNTDRMNESSVTITVHLCEVDTFESGLGMLNFFFRGMSDLSKYILSFKYMYNRVMNRVKFAA